MSYCIVRTTGDHMLMDPSYKPPVYIERQPTLVPYSEFLQIRQGLRQLEFLASEVPDDLVKKGQAGIDKWMAANKPKSVDETPTVVKAYIDSFKKPAEKKE